MTQTEVFDFLKEQRNISDKFFSVREIEKAIKDKGTSNGSIYGLRMDVVRLWESGFLDCKEEGNKFSFRWRRYFRLKKKYA